MGATWLALGWVALGQATGTNSAPPAPRLSHQEFQERLKSIAPEERPATIRAYRERQVRDAQQRPRLQQRPEVAQELTPAEAEARRKQMRARLEVRVTDLEKKQADGTLTPQEETQLDKLQAILKQGPEAFSGNARRRELRPPDPGARPARLRTNSPPAVP